MPSFTRADQSPPTASLKHAATDDPPAPTRTLADLRQLHNRNRRRLTPLGIIAGTHAAGFAAASLDGGATLLPLAASATVAGIAVARSQARGRWARVYTTAAAVGSLTWQGLAAFAGADGVLPAVLWLGGAALALPYWIRHSDPTPDVSAELAAGRAPQPLPAAACPDPRVAAWEAHLGGKGELAGSILNPPTTFAYGWSAVVQLRIGDQWSAVAKEIGTITSVYDLPDGRVSVEAVPGESVRKAKLTVITKDPLVNVRRWSGPGLDPATGTFPIMTAKDGETLSFRLWYPGEGACHALVSGGTGSGKSAALDLILAELAHSDRWIPWIVDGGDGASAPDWVDSPAVPRVATTPGQARVLLEYALDLARRRKHLLRVNKLRALEPAPRMPGIAIVIDEAHNLLMGEDNTDIRRMVEILTQEGRKVAIAVILATQVPSAAQLGGSTVIRGMLKSGTVIGLRTMERGAANMAGAVNLPVPLHQLPAEFPDGSPTRGLGYMLTARPIQARTLYYDPDEQRDRPVPVTDLDEWSAKVPPPVMPSDQFDASETATATPAVAANDTAAVEQVRQAQQDGTPSDIASLMRATGLSLGAVRRALASLSSDVS